MSTEDTKQNAWDRQEGEPSLWYDRFLVYCVMGSSRSIAGAYREWRIAHDPDITCDGDCKQNNAATSTWYEYAREYDWAGRALAYDDYLRDKWSDDERLANAKRIRIELFDKIVRRTAGELAKRQYTETPENQLSATMKTANRELANELGVGQSNVKYNVVLDKLPPDLQEKLADLLK